MNFSFELSGALLTGNINQEAMMGMGAIAGALLGGIAIVRIVILLGLAALMIISRWRIFSKAGLPGWGIFIPFYNRYLMFKLGGRSGRNFLWILIPPVFVVLMIINVFKITERFGKHWGFGIGILFLKIIFIPILAFDNSKYLGKKIISRVISKPTLPIEKAVAKVTVKKFVAKNIIKKAPIKKAPVKKAPAKKTPIKKVVTPILKKKIVTKKK